MKRIVFSVAFFFLFIGTRLLAQGITFSHDKTFAEILQEAKAQDKLIFMDCYTSWCGPCKRLAAQVFPDAEVGAYFNANFINAKFDMEKGEGPDISQRYGIRAYPTLLWLDGEGQVRHKVVGGLDPAGLILAGKKANDPMPGMLETYRQRYKNGARETTFLSDYLNAQNTDGAVNDEVLREFIIGLSERDRVNDIYVKTIFNVTGNILSPGVEEMMVNKAVYAEKMGPQVFFNKINSLAAKAVKDAYSTTNPALFTAAMQLLKRAAAPDAHRQTLMLTMDYAALQEDWKAYDKAATTFFKKYDAKNALRLNDAAWLYFLHMDQAKQLKKAERWAWQSIQADNRYSYNLTYAYLLYKQKKYAEAEKACDYAILRAKEERVAPNSAQSLKENIRNRKP